MLPRTSREDTMPGFEHVRYAVGDGIATLTLHRPERLNAVNTAMLREIVAALDAADGDDGVRAVIVTGAGRAFCAGADLGEGGKTFDYMGGPCGSPHTPPTRGAMTSAGHSSILEEHEDGGGVVTLRVFDMSKPV